MFKAATIGLLGLMANVNAEPSCSAGKYLRVTLWDSFGDGWGDAEWTLTDPSNTVSSVTVTCDDADKVFTVRPTEFTPVEGDYVMTVSSTDSEVPANWWEVYWKVEEMDSSDEPTGVYYEGTYDSVMTWNYDCGDAPDRRRKLPTATDTWTLSSAEDLPDFTCDGCSGGECSKKGKKGPSEKSKKGPIKGGKKDDDDDKKGGKGKGKGGPRDLHTTEGSNSTRGTRGTRGTTSSSNSTRGSTSREVSYGNPNTDLTVRMFAEEECKGPKCKGKNKKSNSQCDGWDDVTRIGAHWYIADSTQTSLFQDGSLCDGCSGSCNICLGDGSYVFRVTGPTFGNETDESDRPSFKSWEFCHARGYFNDQMNFHVKKGKCYPDDLRWSNEICEDEQESEVELSGVIALGGIPSEFFAAQATTLVLDTLARTVNGWTTQQMSVMATSLDARSLTAESRALRSYTHDIQFSVSFVAEDFSVNGASYDAVENLISDMAATLEASFNSGVFTEQLTHGAVTMNVDTLQGVSTVELVSLEIGRIQYAQSHLVYYYSSDEDSVQSGSDNRASTVSTMVFLGFLSVVAVGFIALVGIAHHGVKAYERVSSVTDSEDQSRQDRLAAVRTPFGTSQQNYRPVTAPLQI